MRVQVVFRVEGSGFRGSGFRVYVLGFRVWAMGDASLVSGFRVEGSGLRFRVEGFGSSV